jgi:hypothetical protein
VVGWKVVGLVSCRGRAGAWGADVVGACGGVCDASGEVDGGCDGGVGGEAGGGGDVVRPRRAPLCGSWLGGCGGLGGTSLVWGLRERRRRGG